MANIQNHGIVAIHLKPNKILIKKIILHMWQTIGCTIDKLFMWTQTLNHITYNLCTTYTWAIFGHEIYKHKGLMIVCLMYAS
jgi:hypothetical protein